MEYSRALLSVGGHGDALTQRWSCQTQNNDGAGGFVRERVAAVGF